MFIIIFISTNTTFKRWCWICIFRWKKEEYFFDDANLTFFLNIGSAEINIITKNWVIFKGFSFTWNYLLCNLFHGYVYIELSFGFGITWIYENKIVPTICWLSVDYCIVWNEPPLALAPMSMHTKRNICAIITQATSQHKTEPLWN